MAEIVSHIANRPDDVCFLLGAEGGKSLIAARKAEEAETGAPFAPAVAETINIVLGMDSHCRQKQFWRRLQRRSELDEESYSPPSPLSIFTSPVVPSPAVAVSITPLLYIPPPNSPNSIHSLTPEEESPSTRKASQSTSRPPASSPPAQSSVFHSIESPTSLKCTKSTFGPKSAQRQILRLVPAPPISNLNDGDKQTSSESEKSTESDVDELEEDEDQSGSAMLHAQTEELDNDDGEVSLSALCSYHN